MVTYPMISKKVHRKSLMHIMVIVAAVGTALMLIAGLIIKNNTLSFWVLTIGYMLSNFGLYSFYLIMMISILNTVEYNEYHFGNRNEAVIASVRPFITKLASALIIGVTSITYLLFNVTSYTNKISQIEQDAQIAINNNPNLTEQITADKIAKIDNVIQNDLSVLNAHFSKKNVIVLGNEGNGLSDDFINACDEVVKIPMKSDVESLNVAVASGIILWQLQNNNI